MRAPKKRTCKCGFDLRYHDAKVVVCRYCREAESPEKTCPDCGTHYRKLYSRKCPTCQLTSYIYRAYATGSALAMAAVFKAKNAGKLQPASSFPCVDCGAPAEHYEHRDYNRPLDVEPTCRSCNYRRGNAKPKSWSFDEFWAYYSSLEVSKRIPFARLTRDDFEPIRRKKFDAQESANPPSSTSLPRQGIKVAGTVSRTRTM